MQNSPNLLTINVFLQNQNEHSLVFQTLPIFDHSRRAKINDMKYPPVSKHTMYSMREKSH